jgi:mono/diheme cytochrome c family protein
MTCDCESPHVVIASPPISVATAGLAHTLCSRRHASRSHRPRIPSSLLRGSGLLLDDSQCGPDDPIQPTDRFDHLIVFPSVSQLQRRGGNTAVCDLTPEENLMRSRITWIAVASGLVLIGIGLMRFSLSALQAPGSLETRFANEAKHSVIRRASSHGIPPRPADQKASREIGATHYGLECTICHGVDGHAQTAPGQWMYPRSTDLTSKEVQSYSDQELFWIIKNGIKFTGMPAFGKVETADNIWGLVNYVRTLPSRK